jgi:hypothetical protein
MKIIGIDSFTGNDLKKEIERGGKFVVYSYAISIIVLTFKRSSDIYFIHGGEGSVGKGLKFSVLTLLMGWWGIPWGPIYSIGSLFTNFTGGKNITGEVVQMLNEAPVENVEKNK